tara:strand:- start:168 stop:1295 length:1128 start_codon:yes stop_codon:yes gene_type:complete
MLYNFQINKKANSFLVIDVDAIVSNYQTLKSKLTKAHCAATLKANAYGLGVKKIAHALDKAGCPTFFVATLDEAVELREILNSNRKSILVLNGFLAGTGSIFKQYNITPVLNNFGQLEKWADFNATLEDRQKAALHLDTGMNRLGLDNKDIGRLMENPQTLIKANIYMLLSHLACSDEPENTMNNCQLLEFHSLIGRLPKMTASLANSGGIYLGKKFHFDLVRPGLALYGSVPGHLQNNLTNCISLYGRVLQLREVEKSQSIGYGGTYKLTKKSRIATIGVGYADGYRRSLSGLSTVFHHDFPLPIVGRISMDSLTVDISSLPDNKLKEGDFVELIGKNFTIDQAACLAQTVPYEMITALGRRHYRYYNQIKVGL